jgi:hypothetical protein
LPSFRHVYPTPLTPELTGIDDGNEQKWGKVNASAEAAFEALDREASLDSKVYGELPNQAGVHLHHKTAS